MAKLSVGIGEDFPVEERGRGDAGYHDRHRRFHHRHDHPHHHFWHEFWHRHFAKRRGDATGQDVPQDQDKKDY